MLAVVLPKSLLITCLNLVSVLLKTTFKIPKIEKEHKVVKPIAMMFM